MYGGTKDTRDEPASSGGTEVSKHRTSPPVCCFPQGVGERRRWGHQAWGESGGPPVGKYERKNWSFVPNNWRNPCTKGTYASCTAQDKCSLVKGGRSDPQNAETRLKTIQRRLWKIFSVWGFVQASRGLRALQREWINQFIAHNR